MLHMKCVNYSGNTQNVAFISEKLCHQWIISANVGCNGRDKQLRSFSGGISLIENIFPTNEPKKYCYSNRLIFVQKKMKTLGPVTQCTRRLQFKLCQGYARTFGGNFAMPVMRHFPFNPCPGDEYKRRRYPGEVSEVDIASFLRWTEQSWSLLLSVALCKFCWVIFQLIW